MRPRGVFLLIFCTLSSAPIIWGQPAITPTITEYTLPTTGANPTAIAKGPDGNLWITENAGSNNRIAKITASGLVTEYTIPTANSLPAGIAAGADGNMWFTEASGNKVGKVTPNGTVTEYPLPTAFSRPASITSGPDGNVWFTEATGIGRMTPGGALTEYPLGIVLETYSQITSAPDGNLWFTETATNQVAKITPSGASSQYPLLTLMPPGLNLSPQAIARGPDGNLWIAAGATIWRMTTAGIVTPYPALSAARITAGPDGNLWFADAVDSKIVRLTTDGVLTQYSVTSIGAVTAGPDGNIWFTEPAVDKVAKLDLSVLPPNNVLTLSQRSFTFNGAVNGPPPAAQAFTITQTTEGPFAATAGTLYGNWLTISPSGNLAGNQTITVTVNQANMGAQGEYFGYVILSSGRTAQSVLVTLNLAAPAVGGDVRASPPSLNFNYTIGSGLPVAQETSINTVNPLSGLIPLTISYSIASPAGGGWLTLTTAGGNSLPSGSSGTSGMGILAHVDPTGLSPGIYNASITIVPTGGGTVTVPVSLVVLANPSPTTLSLAPAALIFTWQIGTITPPAQSVQLAESGPPFSYSAQSAQPWLSVKPLAGDPPAILTVSVAPAGLSPGNYTGAITISLPRLIGVTATITVYLTVQAQSQPVIQEFALPDTKANPQYITLGPDGNIWFTEQMGNKIGKISPSGVITEYPLPPNSNPCGITAGPDGNVWFTEPPVGRIARMNSSGAYNEYQISDISALPCEIARGPDAGLWFTEPNAGKIGTITQTRGTLEYPVAAKAGLQGIAPGPDGNVWFAEAYANKIGKITPQGTITEYARSNGSLPSELTTGPDGNLWFTAGGGSQAWIGRITPNGQITEYTNSTVAGPAGIVPGPDGNLWFANYNSGAISSITMGGFINQGYTLPSGSQPSALAAGVDGNIWFTDVTVGKIGRLLLSNPMAIGGLVSSASFAAGAIAPGEIVTIGGSNLGPASSIGLALDSNGKVATSAGGVSVTFNGYAAPVIYVTGSQINCVVPYEIAGASDILVRVSYAGRFSSFSAKGTAASPGIFTRNGSGVGTVAAANSTGAYNGPDNPVAAGSVITFYLTGEGQTNPAGVTGKVTTVDTSSRGPLTPQPVAGAPMVTIGGKPATVLFYGAAPGMVAGVMQLNVQIPAGLPSGNLPLLVSLGSASSQTGVTVAIQ